MTTDRFSRLHVLSILCIATLGSAASANAQSCPDPKRITEGASGPMATVRYLSDDALEGRLAGTPGERCAGDFIAARFKALKLKPAGENNTWFQSVPLASVATPHAPPGTGRNVMALLEGSDPALRNEIIVIGAHYDHLGHGNFGSTAPNEAGAIHNGADDNASGVAGMLAAAEALVKSKPARSVLFMAYTAEESGLIGSAHFVSNPTVPLSRIRAMLNLDMVGRLSAGSLIVYGTGTATEWDDLVRRHSPSGPEVTLNPDGYGASDHTSFYLKDIPVLHFFTNVHSEYHNPRDDWQLIDGPGIQKVATMVAGITKDLGKAPTITLVRGSGRPPAAPGERRGTAAWLGTVPDMKPIERGVLLMGVRTGSPGDAAGLREGDTIIKFDDQEVADLQGLTNALSARKPGDQVRITVIREGREMVVTATLGSR